MTTPPGVLHPRHHPAWHTAIAALQAAGDMDQVAEALTAYTKAVAAPVPMGGGEPVPAPKVNAYGARWCGQHNRWECTGNRSRGRGPCHGLAVLGLNTCHQHQGRNGKVKHLAAVAAAVRGRVVPRDVMPADALLAEVGYWSGLCAWLDEVVEGLAHDTLTWGVAETREHTGGEFPGTSVVFKAGLNTWVAWQQDAHMNLARVCEMALRAQVDVRLTSLAQAQGAVAFRAFNLGLQHLGLSGEQWDLARDVMPQVMRALNAA